MFNLVRLGITCELHTRQRLGRLFNMVLRSDLGFVYERLDYASAPSDACYHYSGS